MPFFQFFSNLFKKSAHGTAREVTGLAEKKAAHFPFDFDRWYPYLKPYTAPSIILPITPPIAQAMVNYYKTRYLNHHELTDEQINILERLEKQLRKELKRMPNPNGYFVRMSDRSPKDGNILNKEKEFSIDQIQLSLQTQDPNEQLIDLMDLQMQLLRCTNAEQILHLLLSSERVYSDLLLALDCHAKIPHDHWSTSIVIRSWQPWLKQEHEFRIFVSGKTIRAISQYNSYCCYPQLIAQNQPPEQLSLIDKISTYLAPLHTKIPFDNYTIDLAVSPDQIQIIELNPFEHSTGTCLFFWADDGALLSGESKITAPELRIQTELNPQAQELTKLILADLEARLDTHEQSYKVWMDEHRNSPAEQQNLAF